MEKYITLLLVFLYSFAFGQNNYDRNGNPSSLIDTSPQFTSSTNLGEKTTNNLNIINQIPSPIEFPNALAFDGSDLWVAGLDEFQLFKISTVDGSVIETFPITNQRPFGMTYDGTNFLIADADTDDIYKYDSTGNLISTITPSVSQPSYCEGLAFDGTSLWFNDPRNTNIEEPNDRTYILDQLGNLLTEYPATGNFPTGLAFDGTYIWSIDNDLDQLHKIDPVTYAVMETYNTPGGIFPVGLTFDGQYLWLVDNDTDLIYQIDIGVLSVSEFLLTKSIKIYPNPSNDFVQVIGLTKKENYKIYNIFGAEIKYGIISNNEQINIENFTSGLYFLKFDNGNTIKFSKK